MCVIVDANCRDKLLGESVHEDYLPVFKWITKAGGKLVFGGRLARELEGSKVGRRTLSAWYRVGLALHFTDDQLRDEETRLAGIGIVRSNDMHVLALAIVSKTRTLCTEDENLTRDFKNRAIVNMPNCRTYRNSEHSHLLKHTPSCPGYNTARKSKPDQRKR